MINIYN